MIAQIFQLQKKEEAKFVCSSCGADRSCDCNAPAVEKLAAKMEQDRQRARRAREKEKAEQNQSSRHVTPDAGHPDKSPNDAPDRIGQDGKSYPAKRTPRGFYSDHGEPPPATEEDYENALLMRADTARELAELPFKGRATDEIVDAVRAVAAAWERLAHQLERESHG